MKVNKMSTTTTTTIKNEMLTLFAGRIEKKRQAADEIQKRFMSLCSFVYEEADGEAVSPTVVVANTAPISQLDFLRASTGSPKKSTIAFDW